MKAVYRGISYETEIPTIEVVEVAEFQQTGFFLGNRFKINSLMRLTGVNKIPRDKNDQRGHP
jgi:hypothetical protein